MVLPQLTEYQTRINHFLEQYLAQITTNDQKLKQAMSYGLLIGGKRMRPYLVYITGNALGANLADLDAVAASLECIHAYSLIHDDLPAMDNDDLRRGQPTCHKKFDEATAILAGDALQTLAFDILSHHQFATIDATQQLSLIQQLSRAAGYQGMCGGQALDMSATNQQIDLTQLEQLHQLKTGALLKAAVVMAATCAKNITSQQFDLLGQYADAIGLAYQVRDDIIDITSSAELLGKPQGSDLAANKSTYPSLLGLTGAQQKADQLLQLALQALHELPYNSDNLAHFARFVVNRAN
jgi:farnesyl diphosphate synthase